MKWYWYVALGMAAGFLGVGWITTILGGAVIALVDAIFHWEDL